MTDLKVCKGNVHTLAVKMFGPFWSVWCKIALAEVGVVLHTRGLWKFSLADIKKIFCWSDLWSKISHVLAVQLETFFP